MEVPDQGRVRQECPDPFNFLPVDGLGVKPKVHGDRLPPLIEAVGFFPSNFAGFSIFNLEVLGRGSACGAGNCAATIPAPTNQAISSGVSMVAGRSRVGSSAPGGALPIGRYCS